jgi:putative FmdB family regulatory protein
MPIYEYACANCGATVEAIQKVDDKPLKKCPECGKNKLSREISAPSFTFKGSGWYINDYAKSGAAEPKKGSKPKESKSEGDSGASEAAKPAEAAKPDAAKPDTKSQAA